jgi:hypothetical protein
MLKSMGLKTDAHGLVNFPAFSMPVDNVSPAFFLDDL